MKKLLMNFMFCVQIENLNIHAVAAQRSFLWIWCGNADGLERGRKVIEFSTEQVWNFLKNKSTKECNDFSV